MTDWNSHIKKIDAIIANHKSGGGSEQVAVMLDITKLGIMSQGRIETLQKRVMKLEEEVKWLKEAQT